MSDFHIFPSDDKFCVGLVILLMSESYNRSADLMTIQKSVYHDRGIPTIHSHPPVDDLITIWLFNIAMENPP